ncbi:MAG TPA: hypothetical protein VGF12_02480 [Roseateles sp.]|uniref:hypothetical protein n=1 Tax=Roseateles sp. TaxID=1971397 RepID=UPI002ED91900
MNVLSSGYLLKGCPHGVTGRFEPALQALYVLLHADLLEELEGGEEVVSFEPYVIPQAGGEKAAA